MYFILNLKQYLMIMKKIYKNYKVEDLTGILSDELDIGFSRI